MHLGDIIKKYREEHGMSQSSFAAVSGISKGYISMLENNRNPSTGEPLAPTFTIFEKVSKVLGCTPDFLLRSMDEDQMIQFNTAAYALDYSPSELMKGIEQGRIHISNLKGIKFDPDYDNMIPKLPPEKQKLYDFIDNLPDDKVDAILRLLGEE